VEIKCALRGKERQPRLSPERSRFNPQCNRYFARSADRSLDSTLPIFRARDAYRRMCSPIRRHVATRQESQPCGLPRQGACSISRAVTAAEALINNVNGTGKWGRGVLNPLVTRSLSRKANSGLALSINRVLYASVPRTTRRRFQTELHHQTEKELCSLLHSRTVFGGIV